MPKNKVQFQRGLSLNRFQQLYGTSQQCEAALFKRCWPDGFVCPKLPLTLWFLAIYLIIQAKEGLSSFNLARFLGSSTNATLRLKHKLQQVMKDHDHRLQLSGIVQIDDSCWGGKRHDGQRGRGASGKTSFLAAVSTNCKGHPIHMRLSRECQLHFLLCQQMVTASFSSMAALLSPMGSTCFAGIGQAGFLHESIVTGGGFVSMQIKVFTWVNTIILGNVKKPSMAAIILSAGSISHGILSSFVFVSIRV